MKHVLTEATTFMQGTDWKDAILLKGSAFAFGLAIGLSFSKHHRKTAVLVGGVGIAAATPLLYKFGKQMKE